jgi:hypothetical protein
MGVRLKRRVTTKYIAQKPTRKRDVGQYEKLDELRTIELWRNFFGRQESDGRAFAKHLEDLTWTT